MKEVILSNTAMKAQSERWLQHEFYRTAVVLGIDIGLEGIGLYLRRVLGGRLFPFSRKVGAIKKGDEFLLYLLPDGSIRKRTPASQAEAAAAFSTFYAVTALSHEGGNPRVELKSRLFKAKDGT